MVLLCPSVASDVAFRLTSSIGQTLAVAKKILSDDHKLAVSQVGMSDAPSN